MAITRAEKRERLKKVEEKISRAKSLVFVGYEGIKSKDQNKLRKIAKENQSEFLVVKKSILKLALNKMKLIENFSEKLNREVGLILGYGDEIQPAKISFNFSQENSNFKIKGGIFNHKFVETPEIQFLATLPSREILLNQLVFSLKLPLINLTNILVGNLKSLIYILNLISQKTN